MPSSFIAIVSASSKMSSRFHRGSTDTVADIEAPNEGFAKARAGEKVGPYLVTAWYTMNGPLAMTLRRLERMLDRLWPEDDWG